MIIIISVEKKMMHFSINKINSYNFWNIYPNNPLLISTTVVFAIPAKNDVFAHRISKVKEEQVKKNKKDKDTVDSVSSVDFLIAEYQL